MYRIDATPTVEAQLAKVAGLRERIQETLIAILDVARDVRRAHGSLAEPGGGFLRVHVGGYMISYTLDLDRGAATVVYVHEVTEGSGNNVPAA